MCMMGEMCMHLPHHHHAHLPHAPWSHSCAASSSTQKDQMHQQGRASCGRDSQFTTFLTSGRPYVTLECIRDA
jgi:hypothetical protein